MTVDDLNLTASKRRVITLLNRHGTMTKRELAQMGQMGWATVVKVINQLMEDGIITTFGTQQRQGQGKGKHAYLYGMTHDRPLAIGIDVEYRTTSVLLTNLRGDLLAESSYETPEETGYKPACEFLRDTIADFAAKHDVVVSSLAGIGIGMPGIGFISPAHRDKVERSRDLERYLSEQFSTLVRIETNTKAYAVFEKWSNETFGYSDFIFVAIRTGVGTGIFYDGKLFNGSHNLAGEIGHMKVVPDGPPCRCGSAGCMETVVNRNYLLEQYRTHVLKQAEQGSVSRSLHMEDGLADLFSRAKAGEKSARLIVDTAALHLGQCIANAIAVLDITNIIISGHFGEDGDAIVEPVKQVVRNSVLPRVDFEIAYVPFDPAGHTHGAALLVLNDYFVDVPPRSSHTAQSLDKEPA